VITRGLVILPVFLLGFAQPGVYSHLVFVGFHAAFIHANVGFDFGVVGHKIQGKNGNFGPAVGPFRVVVVYGGTAESAAGQCSEVTFTGAQCVLNGSGTTLTCT